jgi:hypothetical protein
MQFLFLLLILYENNWLVAFIIVHNKILHILYERIHTPNKKTKNKFNIMFSRVLRFQKSFIAVINTIFTMCFKINLIILMHIKKCIQ